MGIGSVSTFLLRPLVFALLCLCYCACQPSAAVYVFVPSSRRATWFMLLRLSARGYSAYVRSSPCDAVCVYIYMSIYMCACSCVLSVHVTWSYLIESCPGDAVSYRLHRWVMNEMDAKEEKGIELGEV